MQAMMLENSLVFESPSFNSYSSDMLSEIAAKVANEFNHEEEEEELQSPPPPPPPPPPMLSQSFNDQPQPEENEDDQDGEDGEEDEDGEGDDFEFSAVGRDPCMSPISADEIFSNGQIQPVFPLFNRNILLADSRKYDSKPPKTTSSSHRRPLRKLMIEEEREIDYPPSSSSSSEADELEGIPDESYCVWTAKPVEASPEICKKSNSTGSSKKSWKFRDLLYRSNSEGMDNYVFLSPSKSMVKRNNDKTEKTVVDRMGIEKRSNSISSSSSSSSVSANQVNNKVRKVKKAGEALSAHEIHYVRYRISKEEDRRRSYLPYRQDLVGLFGNVKV